MREEQGGDPGSDVLPEWVLRGFGDEKSSPSYVEIERYEDEYPEESQFLRNHRKNEISFDFRQIAEFLDGFPESETEKPSAPDGDESLFGLEVDGFLLDGVFIVCKEIVHSVGYVRERVSIIRIAMLPEPVDGERKYRKNSERSQKMLGISSPNKEHGNHERRTDKDGTEVRLEHEESYDNPEDEHIREESVGEIGDLRAAFFEEIRKIDDQSELHEFDRLEGEGEEWYIDPSLGSVVRGSHEKHQYEGKDPYDKYLLGVFFKHGIRRLDHEGEEQKTEEYVRDILEQVEVIVRLGKRPIRHHERGDLEGRVDAHGTYHDHPEDDERQNDEKYGVVDVFGFHGGE